MAKKKTKTAKSSAPKARAKPAGKAGKKSSPQPRVHDHSHDDTCCDEEVVLDDTEKKTIDMVLDSDKIRLALETEVSAALTATVRKFCRQHGASLSAAQAQNVAMVLFGD
jgi:hypothetical protein